MLQAQLEMTGYRKGRRVTWYLMPLPTAVQRKGFAGLRPDLKMVICKAAILSKQIRYKAALTQDRSDDCKKYCFETSYLLRSVNIEYRSKGCKFTKITGRLITRKLRVSPPPQISNAATKTPTIVNATASFTAIAINIPNHVAAPTLPARNMSL